MIVNNLDIFRTVYDPAKANSKLIIYAYAVLACTIAMKCF